MSDPDDIDGVEIDELDGVDLGESLDDLDIDDERIIFDEEETELDRTRTAYSGARLDDEFQPVDEVELAEEGMLLDDPEHPNRRRRDLDADDEGWDLDEEG
jgi:hypothetical protein